MSATSKTDWFWSDWLGDQAVRRLTPAERGVWIDCLALMATASPIGYLCDDTGRKLTHEEVARVVNATPVEVSNLLAAILAKGAASVDRTGRIYNRRMVRAASTAAKKRLSGKRGGDATRLKWQQLSGSPQQNARQVPRHATSPPSHLSKIRSSEFLAARERERSAGSLATALDDGALTRPPEAEQAKEKRPFEGKLPNQMTKQELDEFYAAKRAREAKPEPKPEPPKEPVKRDVEFLETPF